MTTEKYNFTFILPNRLRTMPIPFSKYAKYDENNNIIGYMNYDEWVAQDGYAEIATPSGTHVMLGDSATSIFDLATKFQMYLAQYDATVVIKEGVDEASWLDAVQDDYLWVLYSDPQLSYGLEAFKQQSQLFQEVVA